MRLYAVTRKGALSTINNPDYQLSKTTKKLKGPWKLVYTVECETRNGTMKIEKAIKERGIWRYLESAQLVKSRLQRD